MSGAALGNALTPNGVSFTISLVNSGDSEIVRRTEMQVMFESAAAGTSKLSQGMSRSTGEPRTRCRQGNRRHPHGKEIKHTLTSLRLDN